MIDEFYKKYTDVFLTATNELVDIFEKITPKVEIKEHFSTLLLKIYQCYMTDVFPSCNLLVQNQSFFSFAILCRSTLDITVQLMWILDITPLKKKQKAIECFLNFDGTGEYTNDKGKTKKTNQWQDIILKERFVLGAESKHSKSEFDYLSKVIHWNPKIINELVGIQSGHLIFGPEKLKMFFIASSEFIKCSLSFLIIFIDHFYPNEYREHLEKATEIQKKCMESFHEVNKLCCIKNPSDKVE